MILVRKTEEFDAWLGGLQDAGTRGRLVHRLDRVARGTLGDCGPVGEGVHELREHFGPGWRMYFVYRGRTIIVLIGGGTKRSQKRDIKEAIEISRLIP
jgi:putative addiction module killer protein